MKTGPGTYRYGTPRTPGEGLRIGVARYVPRGVRREDWKKKGYFDLWLPLLAPSAGLVKEYLHDKITRPIFVRRYRTEMRKPECRQVIDFLAGLSQSVPFSVGCYCEDESHCHRSVLHELICQSRSAKEARPGKARAIESCASVERYASPVCYAQWEENEE
jgi:uncharacterized protein YeaO (DUF488 family)